MTYLVDTDWVIDFLKGKSGALSLFTTLSRDGIAISLVIYGEIYEGIYYGADPKRQERAFLALLRGVDVLQLNRQIMKRFARIRGELRAKGTIIADPDILIAATAFYHQLTLVTRNTKHFKRVPGLSIYSAK